MEQDHVAALTELLLSLIPPDGSPIGNQTLRQKFSAELAAKSDRLDENQFEPLREALIDQGVLGKGKGRGGSVFRTRTAQQDFTLQMQDAQPTEAAPAPTMSKKPAKAAPRASSSDEAQVLSYRHLDRRRNNPEVGVVSEATDPAQPQTSWSYDPHLDPALQFDCSRASLEKLIDDALASGDQEAMRLALEELKRLQSPYLNWSGKAERTSFAVDTVSLHVHERMDPMSILSAVRKQIKQEKAGRMVQAGLFEAPFESLPLRDAIDFYKHDRGWANRLVAGDSLLVMNSLLQKEGMAGQVQMIYLDPPYGIKYGSNFQPFVGKRDVKDRSDADLTQEPEMIKAFRDTWELGIHSYLTYLRDRLLLAKELLHESGSVFVQISDENLHHVRELMDEVFGTENFMAQIVFRKKTMPLGANFLEGMDDYLIWFSKNKRATKYRQLFVDKDIEGDQDWKWAKFSDIRVRQLTKEEHTNHDLIQEDASIFRLKSLEPSGPMEDGMFTPSYQGKSYDYPKNGYGTNPKGMDRLIYSDRVQPKGKFLNYRLFLKDYSKTVLHTNWRDTVGADNKKYVVQTNTEVITRCLLMTTDPGDLVLDPTCGSGTTAYVAEKWGRRWITCDTSRVAVTLAKQRLTTASFDYFELRYPHEGLKGGFIYKTVPHVTLKSIANNPEIDEIYERMHPAIETALGELNKAAGTSLKEWEVPFDFPAGWSESTRAPFDTYHKARQAMQRQMDFSIASHAESEILYDQPQPDKKKLRITGPFTVEAVPFPTVFSLDESEHQHEADVTIARSGESSRQHQWRDDSPSWRRCPALAIYTPAAIWIPGKESSSVSARSMRHWNSGR